MDLVASDTRVFLFHSPQAARDSGGAMSAVNAWLSKDRSQGPYANLSVREITLTPDGAGGVYTIVVCTLGQVAENRETQGGEEELDSPVEASAAESASGQAARPRRRRSEEPTASAG
jgi:hypothetical protein